MAFKVEVETAPESGVWNDYTNLVMVDSLVVTSQGGAEAGTSTALFRDIAGTAVVLPECGYRVTDGTTVIFRGKIKKRGKTERYTNPRGKWYAITAQDATSLLVDDVVDTGGLRTGSRSDKTEVEWLLTTYGTKGVVGGATVQSTGTISRDIDYTGLNLYEALIEAGNWLGVRFYVATDLALHWYISESNSAPFNLSDAPNNTTTFGYDGFDAPDDSLDLTNAVFVIGGDGVGEWVPDPVTWPTASQTAYGRKESAYKDGDLMDSAARQAAGQAILDKYSNPRGPIKMTVYRPGLKADQTIQITNSTYGLSAVTYRIAEVTASVNGNTGTFKYDVSLQDAPIALQNVIGGGFARTERDIDRSTNNAVVYAEQFLIGRVKVVSVLPTLPDANYPIGSQVFYSVDNKLYRNPDDVMWTAAVYLADGVGHITGTQIADDAISTPHIAANSISGAMIQAGAITADNILANSLTAGTIAAGAIGAEALASQIVLADTLFTTDLPPNQRVEIDDAGVRAYDANNQRVVNIPAVGTDPVEVVGKIETGDFTSNASAELRGVNTLAGGSITTAQQGVINPPAAPSVAVDTPVGRTLASAPTNPGSGLCYDPLGGTGLNTPVYYVGANPTIGNLLDVAYEYRASDGVLLRAIQKTGTTVTVTGATAGSTSHVSDTAEARDSVDQSNIATPITMPARSGMEITKVSVYIAGFGGTETCRVGIWNDVSGTGNSLRESATFDVASRTFSNGNAVQYNKSLSSPLAVASGATIYAGWRRTANGPGFWWDRDDGSGKTTYAGAGYTADGTAWGVWNSASKPNVFVTYNYTTDSSLEGAMTKIIGVARVTGSDVLWVLDSSGTLYKYTLSTGDYVTKVAQAANILGTDANAGLFYDATAARLVVVSASGTTGTDQVRFLFLDPSTGAVSGTAVNSTGFAINGSTAVIRGGYLSGGYYHVVVNGVVKVYLLTGSAPPTAAAYASNYDFGQSTECADGIVAGPGTWGSGRSSSNPTKIYEYTSLLAATSTTTCHIAYAWYKSTATTRETMRSPLWTGTIGRRRRYTVSNPAIPVVAGETPDKVRVYGYNAVSTPATGAMVRIVEDALTNRSLTSWVTSGNDASSNTFPAGDPAILKSVIQPGWELKGDGTVTLPDTGWQSVTYLNSWSDYSTTWAGARYRRDAMGYVHLSGMVKGTTINTVCFQLPAGFRPGPSPTSGLLFGTHANGSVSARIDVQPDGDVLIVSGSTGWTTLDGITFKAEQ